MQIQKLKKVKTKNVKLKIKSMLKNNITKLELVWKISKPNWIWFGIYFRTNLTQLFSKPNWIWFGNICQFLKDNFPNQTGFGLETDTE